jgi:hypothetical protein
MHNDGPPSKPVTGLRRTLYAGVGLGFVALAVLGAMLPVLPSTPFVLLASYFFVRSSPRLHSWLLRSRLFGGMLRDWQKHRAVRPRVVGISLAMLTLAVGSSAAFGRLPGYLMATLVLLALAGAIVVLRLPVIRDRDIMPTTDAAASDQDPSASAPDDR